LFAIATGQAVACNYLAQPLLEAIRQVFGVTAGLAGLIVTVAQLGYAAGLVLLLTLGDLFERRRLITALAAITAVFLAAAALAPSLGLFLAAAGLIGFTSVMAQILVPFAAGLSPEDERGRVVGIVMSGLLLGILLARTVSGLVAQVAGWRAVYGLAATLMAVQMIVLYKRLPTFRQRVSLSYPRLCSRSPAPSPCCAGERSTERSRSPRSACCGRRSPFFCRARTTGTARRRSGCSDSRERPARRPPRSPADSRTAAGRTA
jgi:predicted MFS family arabinose efflux permease